MHTPLTIIPNKTTNLESILIEKKTQANLAFYFHEHKEEMGAKMKEFYYKKMMALKK